MAVAVPAGEEGVQYNTARTLRHLALGCHPAHKKAALPAVIPLTQALQVLLAPYHMQNFLLSLPEITGTCSIQCSCKRIHGFMNPQLDAKSDLGCRHLHLGL